MVSISTMAYTKSKLAKSLYFAEQMEEKWVKKSHGELVRFDTDKLRRSLLRSGAGEELIELIIEKVAEETESVTTTKIIYNKAYKHLKRASSKLAGKYRLKEAIYQLGPSGYPLEHYIGHLLAYQGFEIEVGIMMQGRCLKHEVDVYAVKEELKAIVESKHHSRNGHKSDVKVAMYVHSRFQDIINSDDRKDDKHNYRCVIATNTRFTLDAITYAECYDISLISWDYPHRGSLKERIEISGLYPITCLHSLTKSDKQKLLNEKTVLCKQLIDDPELLRSIDQRKHVKILEECQALIDFT